MYKSLEELGKNESFSDYIRSMSDNSVLQFYKEFCNRIIDRGFIRQSEYIGGKNFDGDIVYLEVDDALKVTEFTGAKIKINGNVTKFFDGDSIVGCFRGHASNFNKLEGEIVRYIFDYTSNPEINNFNIGVTLKCEDNKIKGEMHCWGFLKKPFKISKVCEFTYADEKLEVNVIPESLIGFNRVASCLLSYEYNNYVMSDLSAKIFDHFNVTNEIHHVFDDGLYVLTYVATALNLFLFNHLAVVLGLGEYAEREDGKLGIGDTFKFYPKCISKSTNEDYSGDYLEVGSDWLKPDMEYLKLVSKIAQLGSDIVVPRDEILSYSEYKEKYFTPCEPNSVHKIKDTTYLPREEYKDLFPKSVWIGESKLTLFESHVEAYYFSYVWNNLYFKLPKIWSKIRIMNKKEPGFIIKFDDVYNTLTLTHLHEGEEVNLIVFRGDVDLSDLSVKLYQSNFILKGFRPEFISYDSYGNIEHLIDKCKDELSSLFSSETDVYVDNVLELFNKNTDTQLIFNLLTSKHYSLGELISMFSIKDNKELKNNIIAGEIEDYSSSLINYILVSVLIAEKDKIKLALDELESEMDEETPEMIKREIKDKLDMSDVIEVKKSGDRVTYVFNGVKVKSLNRVLGHHLKRRKAKFKYTTPYWVRRGHFKTDRSGERVWVPEQICRRNPELLSVRVGEEESGRVYKLTNLFK